MNQRPRVPAQPSPKGSVAHVHAEATAMYHTGKNPLRKITRESESVDIVRGDKRRRLHTAFLRYHDATNCPLLREP